MNLISLFCGAGGLDLGFEKAGFKPVVAYDIMPAAVETYNHNRKGETAIEGDLSTLSGDDIIREIGKLYLAGNPVGVVGGPPCQYFSNGNRSPKEDDPRRDLPVRYAEILEQLHQRYNLHFFILENVSGLAKPAHKEDFKKIIGMFEQTGFHVSYDLLDAYNFGVPQYRERVFVVGWSKNLYPEGEYKFPKGQPCGLNIEDLIQDLEKPQFYKRNADPEQFPEHPNHWTMNPISKKFRNPPPPDLKKSTRSFRRLSWDQPSYTVAYGHNEIHVHPEGHRRLSIFEAMLLQGFERDYRLMGNLSQQVTLISDAVPPPLAKALAESIKAFIEKHHG